MKHDIFISYSTKDKDAVLTIMSGLKRQGYKIWMDEEGITPGDPSFKRTLVDAIGNSRVFLFFSSTNSNSSEWTAKEIGIAVEQKKYIIPIKLDHSPYDKSVKFDLINCDFVDFATPQKKKTEKDKLLSCLEVKLGKKSTEERHLDTNSLLNKLAELYRKGDGVPRDYTFAASLYKKSADQGNPTAQCNLASLYYHGLGVEKDLAVAASLYKMASQGGSALATFKLGKMYFYGTVGTTDKNRAILLYQEAAAKGCKQATNELNKIKAHIQPNT